MHTALVAGWADSMALYELAIFDPSNPLLGITKISNLHENSSRKKTV